MSQESLRKLLDRLNSDASFGTKLAENPDEALNGLDLSPTERMALASNDEDALRRLAGDEVSGYTFFIGPVSAQHTQSAVSLLRSHAFGWCGNTYGTYAGPC